MQLFRFMLLLRILILLIKSACLIPLTKGNSKSEIVTEKKRFASGLAFVTITFDCNECYVWFLRWHSSVQKV